MPLTKVLQAKI